MLCMSGSIQTVSEDILPKAAKQESEEVPVVFQTEDRQEVCSQCATMNNILFSLVICKHLSMSYKVALHLNSNHMLVKCMSIDLFTHHNVNLLHKVLLSIAVDCYFID